MAFFLKIEYTHFTLCVGCRLGLHFSAPADRSKKNESERRPSKKNSTAAADRLQTHTLKILKIIYL